MAMLNNQMVYETSRAIHSFLMMKPSNCDSPPWSFPWE